MGIIICILPETQTSRSYKENYLLEFNLGINGGFIDTQTATLQIQFHRSAQGFLSIFFLILTLCVTHNIHI